MQLADWIGLPGHVFPSQDFKQDLFLVLLPFLQLTGLEHFVQGSQFPQYPFSVINILIATLHHGNSNPKHEYYLESENGREVLPKGEEELDLGVYFTVNLKFDKQVNEAVRKANMILGLIKRNFSYIDRDVFNKLYKSLVRPHLEYAQEVWQPYLKKHSILMENVQRRATKLIPESKKK